MTPPITTMTADGLKICAVCKDDSDRLVAGAVYLVQHSGGDAI